jgi:hypothetical protein
MEGKRMNKEESTEKVPIYSIKPTAMTPLTEGVKSVAMTPVGVRMQANDALKPVAMTPVASGEDRGLKPPAMTPAQPAPSPTPPQPVQPPKK